MAKTPSKEPTLATQRSDAADRRGGGKGGSLTERLHRGTQASIMMRRRQVGSSYQTGGGSDAFLNDNREQMSSSSHLGKRAHNEVQMALAFYDSHFNRGTPDGQMDHFDLANEH